MAGGTEGDAPGEGHLVRGAESGLGVMGDSL